ncbi:MAG: hypothetical protein IJU48_05040 [Synergistaceae bacterium]|nr:hypothetical protein [Synergistaceae bacterium]
MSDISNTLTKVAIKAGPVLLDKAAPLVAPVAETVITTTVAVAPIALPLLGIYAAYKFFKD